MGACKDAPANVLNVLSHRPRVGYLGRMQAPPPALERAFQIARSGACATVGDIRARLNGEGFANIDSQLDTLAIRKALTRLCIEAQAQNRLG